MTNRTATVAAKAKKKRTKKVTEKGLKLDVGSLTSSSLAGITAFFDALNKSDKRAPVITGSVQIGKKKSVTRRA